MLELDVQRSLTKAFINTMPVQVVLQPRVRTRTASGGWVWTPGPPRPVQTMRLVEPSTVNNVAPRPVQAQDGQERKIDFFLLGEWDATIGLYDTFTYQGYTWEVIELAHDNGYEQRAAVARHA
jgi:hypothetical protein